MGETVGEPRKDAGPVAPPRKRRGLRLSMFPTMLTLGNLVCGVLAISYVADASALFAGNEAPKAAELIVHAGWLILLGMVFDALDGRVARLTRSTTNFGGALDSLSDLVTFGVAPALIAKTIAERTLDAPNARMAFVTAAFFAVCAALRLARYNAEHDEPDQAVQHFNGLPTPGAAGVIAGLAIAHNSLLKHWPLDERGRVIAAGVLTYGLLIGLGLAMVSRVPYIHFANRYLSGRRPIGSIALLVLVVVLVLQFEFAYVAAAGFLAYSISGPIGVIPRLVRGKREEVVPELFE
jgi:CDP-diacylglycerol--serine O-phosphatidyltransferase